MALIVISGGRSGWRYLMAFEIKFWITCRIWVRIAHHDRHGISNDRRLSFFDDRTKVGASVLQLDVEIGGAKRLGVTAEAWRTQ